jgi:hypothetical protein
LRTITGKPIGSPGILCNSFDVLKCVGRIFPPQRQNPTHLARPPGAQDLEAFDHRIGVAKFALHRGDHRALDQVAVRSDASEHLACGADPADFAKESPVFVESPPVPVP